MFNGFVEKEIGNSRVSPSGGKIWTKSSHDVFENKRKYLPMFKTSKTIHNQGSSEKREREK